MGFCGLLFFLTANIIFISVTASQDFRCTGTGSYTLGSPFEENLKATINSLYTHAPHSNGFYKTSIGQFPNRIFGLFLCNANISPDLCYNCVKASGVAIQNLCPKQKEAIIWFDDCLLRYSDRSSFSDMENSPKVIEHDREETADMFEIEHILNGLKELLPQALSSTKLFATGPVNLTGSEKLYGLLQCTPYLTATQCSQCLYGSSMDITDCCYGKQEGRILRPSCIMRYGRFPFKYSLPAPPAPSPLPSHLLFPRHITSSSGKRKMSKETIFLIALTIAFLGLLSTLCYYLKNQIYKKISCAAKDKKVEFHITNQECSQYDFRTIEAATNQFCCNNKIGEGGFGSVYKGKLSNGKMVAVKRLSNSSGQGAEEFRNEVTLLFKLQHRNLVRLLGYCLEKEEKILVYEFVSNKSLDYFLFDPEKQGQLDWPKRYNIIRGIARGLLYLHQDSHLNVVHRDLKPSNVLLDEEMNPKISDFGLARTFTLDQNQRNTSRVIGTFGYMSPEYAMHGQFSVKSDVFSFGVLVLEIINGKMSRDFIKPGNAEDFLYYVWRQWKAGTSLELMDPILKGSHLEKEVARCIHVGLLCVQEDPADRPGMATVVFMLHNLQFNLPLPKSPTLFAHCKAKQSSITKLDFEKFKCDKYI